MASAPPEPLGGVRNLQVLNPTMTTLNVRWEPAEGRVKEYKVIYVPAAGGAESMVGLVGHPGDTWWPSANQSAPHTRLIIPEQVEEKTFHLMFAPFLKEQIRSSVL